MPYGVLLKTATLNTRTTLKTEKRPLSIEHMQKAEIDVLALRETKRNQNIAPLLDNYMCIYSGNVSLAWCLLFQPHIRVNIGMQVYM